MKKPYLWIFIMVFLLALLKIFFTAKLATSGSDLVRLEEQAQKLEEENLILREETVSFSSLARVSSEAAKLGFDKAEKVISLTGETPIALKQR